MPLENQKNKPVILIALTILFVIVISYFIGGVTIFGYTIKPADLFMDIKPDSLLSYNNFNGNPPLCGKSNSVSDYTFSSARGGQKQKLNPAALSASVSFDLIRSLIYGEHNNKPARQQAWQSANYYKDAVDYQEPPTNNVPLSGNVFQMKYFFDALKKAGSEKIRVAHYGDSGNEGDAITANIREDLQQKFGGKGVGFLSITSQDITFRTTTKESFSNNWSTTSVVTGNANNMPLGINGELSIPQGVSWVNYQTTNWLPYLKTFNMARVFYSNAKASTVNYSFNNGSNQSATLQPGNTLKELKLNAPGGSAESFRLTTTFANQAYFYGVSLEDGNGVYVDNFPWRGNTGLGFTSIPESSFMQFGKMLNYKLIILAFGANETSFNSTENTWYANQMVKVIDNLKKAFPQTSFLLIGVGDRGIKRGTRFITDPNVPLLLKVQQDIANMTGIAFWNLFEAMGGNGAIEKWVHANPPLAYMDYTHPSWQGSAKIGDMIANAIMQAYYNYK
ncbi:MAG: SGNH/GDSL hydrolase family protein [Ignavibacteriaceae bacterium]